MEIRSVDAKKLEEIMGELEQERKEYSDKISELEFRIKRDNKIIAFYYAQLNQREERIEAVKKAIDIINRYTELLALVEQALAEKGYFGNEITAYIATKLKVVEEAQIPSLVDDTELTTDKDK